MANEAVDPTLVGKVKGCVLPTVPGMTARTTRPIAENTHAEIIDGDGTLTQIHALVLAQSVRGRAFPQPVRGTQHLLPLSRVASKAFPGYFEWVGFSRELDKVGMVPDSLFVATAGAADGSPVELLVAARTLAVDSTLEPHPVRGYGVKGVLMAGRTPHGLCDIRLVCAIMVTRGTQACL